MWNEKDQVRLMPKVQKLYRLGERSVFELLHELVADDEFLAIDVEHLLDKYGRLDPAVVDLFGGRDLWLPLTVVQGGRR